MGHIPVSLDKCPAWDFQDFRGRLVSSRCRYLVLGIIRNEYLGTVPVENPCHAILGVGYDGSGGKVIGHIVIAKTKTMRHTPSSAGCYR